MDKDQFLIDAISRVRHNLMTPGHCNSMGGVGSEIHYLEWMGDIILKFSFMRVYNLDSPHDSGTATGLSSRLLSNEYLAKFCETYLLSEFDGLSSGASARVKGDAVEILIGACFSLDPAFGVKVACHIVNFLMRFKHV